MEVKINMDLIHDRVESKELIKELIVEFMKQTLEQLKRGETCGDYFIGKYHVGQWWVSYEV